MYTVHTRLRFSVVCYLWTDINIDFAGKIMLIGENVQMLGRNKNLSGTPKLY